MACYFFFVSFFAPPRFTGNGPSPPFVSCFLYLSRRGSFSLDCLETQRQVRHSSPLRLPKFDPWILT